MVAKSGKLVGRSTKKYHKWTLHLPWRGMGATYRR